MESLRQRIERLDSLRSSTDSEISVFDPKSIESDRVGFRPIYSMKRDGTDVKFLFAVPGMLVTAAPELSHNEKYLAVEAKPVTEDNRTAKIFVCGLQGPFKGTVRYLGYGNAPTWSPDDRQIAIMLNSGTASGEDGGIYLMNADGSDRTWLCKAWYPRWSPDGKYLAAYGYEDGGSLVLVEVETREVRSVDIRGMRLRAYSAGWSPDSQRVAFAGLLDGKDSLCTMDIHEGEQSIRVLYTHDDPATRLVNPPAWSPDGRQIVFGIHEPSRGRGDSRLHMNSYLYSITTDVPIAPVLIEGQEVGVINRAPSWSADGRRIIFTSER